MAKNWAVEVGEQGEGNYAIHTYESPRDAVKVARRYMRRSVNDQKLEGPIRNMKLAKNYRVLGHDDTSDTAGIREIKTRPKNFAFRK